MEEKLYMILDDVQKVIAKDMTFENAIVFIKGYQSTYYNEKLELTILEQQKRYFMEEDYYDDDCPCDTCSKKEYCDHWEARYCCEYCQWLGGDDCDNCNPMDI